MSLICGKLCSALILEHFGPIVQAAGDDLFNNGPRPLDLIRSSTGLPLKKLKEALCVLIKFSYVSFKQMDRWMTYTLEIENVISILRYSRYIYFVKNTCGDEAQLMFEEVLKSGYETGSQIIVKTYQKLEQFPPERRSSVPVLKETFELLVKNNFLMRSQCTGTLSDLPTDKPDFTIPELNIKSMIIMTQGNEADAGDSKVYWKVNFDRFNQDLRDQVIVSAIAKRLDINSGELMRQLLILMYLRTASWAETSNPIPLSEIKDSVKKLDCPMLTQYLDQYLSLIVEDSSKFLNRVGDSGGGQFSVDMKEAICQLAWTTMENIVLERFGSKAARIFRIVRIHKHIELEKIHKLVLINEKEAKQITYMLLAENYLQMQELKKAGVSTAPAKMFFLFHINLNNVVRMEVEHCYHTLYNLIQKREHEMVINKRMIDKQLRIRALTSTLKEHGAQQEKLELIAEMMSPSEQLQLDKVEEMIKKLGISELHTDDTLFLLSMYLRYHCP